LIQQRISPRGNVAPMAGVCQQSSGGIEAISQLERRSIGIEIKVDPASQMSASSPPS
jgi:hypothetical protein